MKVKTLLHSLLLVFGCLNAQSLQYYFGNLHAHTAFSDGNKDSLNSHVWSPAGSYAYAKQSLHFDFLGIAEHNHYSSPKNPGFRKQNYQAGLSMASAANLDGSFAALFGMEWGVSSSYNGHVLIYGFNQLIGWETNVPGVSGNNYDVFNDKNDYDALFKKVKNNKASFAYLAHPNFNDFSSGSAASSLANGSYNADYDSAIVGMPLRSGLAFSTAENYLDYPLGDYFLYYKKMLYQGYHLGIGYDHDNHYTTFGRSNAGRLVIMAPDLSPANVVKAMQDMRFYGSDDWNAKVDFQINAQPMGSIFSDVKYPSIGIVHQDDDGELCDSIKIWKGSKNSGGLWASVIHTSLRSNTSAYIDFDVQSGIEYYYFIEIKQADGDWIVTSPIWFKAQAPLKTKATEAFEELQINFNATNKYLSLSCSDATLHKLQILDLNGQLLIDTSFSGHDAQISLIGLNPGLYLMRLTSVYGTQSKKLLIL